MALAPGGPGNLDVIELDAASHGGVDDTRELRDRAFYAPSESRYRVFIVDEAHMVTNAGFNALLKIVEEPPEHLIFIFATTEPEKVLPTIRSRTHHYPFRLLAPPVMRGLLEKICASEGVTVVPEVYPLVIRAGGGSPRDSLSILDQLLAGSDEDGVTYDRALSLLGVTDIALIDDAIDGLAAADGGRLFGTVERVVDAGHDPRRFAVDLLERLRDLILLQAVPDAVDRGLVEAPGDQLDRMRAQIDTLGPAALTRYAETVHAALGEMRGTTSPRLLLEVMCARMLLPAASADDAALLQRLERLESGVATTPPATVLSSVDAAPGIAVPAAPAADEPAPRFVRPSQRKAVEPDPPTTDPQPEPVAPQSNAEDLPREPEPVSVDPQVETPVVERATVAPEPERESRPQTLTPPTPTRPEVASEPRPDATQESAFVDDVPLPDEPLDDESAIPEVEPVAAQQSSSNSKPEPTSSGLSIEEMRKRYQEVREAVRDRSKSLEPMLSAAMIHDLQDRTVVLGHPIEVLVGRLSASHAVTIIRDALQQVFGVELDVRTVHVPPGAAAPASNSGVPATPPQGAARRQTFSRPSQGGERAGDRQNGSAPTPSEAPQEPEEPSGPPEPPTPDEELTDAERDEMVEQAKSSGSDARLDPEQVAMDLLKSELGARPLE
ncbi:DNA polymerase III subunit gamma/tau [Gordonia effusa NBRC 100432]|uniref:DNA polymerase III subunit gamma/tau n=1 Tax=Gordonia effusa NBRC 100432 TaxID=1077974 RepID=H0R0E1_9ACTN|nr:DNA polymerase III subunit gamma/tau [Gordonia effusa NBRC 100432]